MKKLRMLSFALLGAMLLTACGGETPSNDDTSNDTTVGTDSSSADTELKANIPADAYYEDYEFRILARGGGGMTDWAQDDLVVDEEEALGDIVYKAVYERNLAVKELLGVDIVRIAKIGNGEIANAIVESVMSQEDLYDVVMPTLNRAATYSQEGYLVPLSELTYMDLSKPWYDQRCLDDFQVYGENYFFFSDATIRQLGATWLYYFNKQMIDSYGLEDPYELVESGKWTMDKMTEMMKAAAVDDGDGIPTENDKWGLVAHDYVITASYIGSGERVVTAGSDGQLSLTMNTDRIHTVIEKIVGLQDYWIRNSLTARSYGTAIPYGFAPDDDCDLMGVFTSGNSLFYGEVLLMIEFMRESEIEFGIVPSPKLDEDQEEYYSAVNQVAAPMAIPVTNPDLERTSVIIEALAAESHDTLVPAYYETAIKSKYTRDTISAEMLDMIFDSVSYDLGIYYNWGKLSGKFCHLVYNGGEGFASMYDANSAVAEAELEAFLESIE